jgi:hypothetical protein
MGHNVSKKILVCGIRDHERRNVSNFFVSQDDGTQRFCESLVSGEGEAKKILSTYQIDEIIAIGSASQVAGEAAEDADASAKQIPLNKGIDLMQADLRGFSDFDFFRYRLTQFVMGVDIDSADFLGAIDAASREKLVAAAHALVGEDLSQSLSTILSVKGICDRLEQLSFDLTIDERDWLLRYLFSNLAADSKMRAQTTNAAVPISFLPISAAYGLDEVTRFQDLIRQLLLESEEEAELYVDLHGLPVETASLCASTLYALSDDAKSPITVRAISSVSNTAVPGVCEISMQHKHYRIEKLMSGIAAFLNNGKTDILCAYWDEAKQNNPGLNNEYIDKILTAMGYVDAGLSLCSISDLSAGMLALRKLLNHPDEAPEATHEEESFLIMMVRQSVMSDYGPLMDESSERLDPFELIKWSYRKKFYQQVLTIIESQMAGQIAYRGIFYAADTDEEVLAYKKALNIHYWDVSAPQRWILKDLNHYFLKTYGRFTMEQDDRSGDSRATQYLKARVAQVFGDSMKRNLLPAHSLVDDEQLLYEFLDRYYALARMRNSVNHAEKRGVADGDLPAVPEAWKQCEQDIAGFIDCYERVLANIGDKKAENRKPMIYKEFQEYFKCHGPRECPDYNLEPGYSPQGRAKPRKKSGFGSKPAGAAGPKPASTGEAKGGEKPAAEAVVSSAPAGGKAVATAALSSGDSVTVTATIPASVLSELKADGTKKGEICVRLSFE